MASAPGYLVIGSGRWGAVIQRVLHDLGRSVHALAQSPRQRPEETNGRYADRLIRDLASCKADIAWISTPPSPQTPVIVKAAIESGMHVVVEKPWAVDHELTDQLSDLAESMGKTVAVHFQYGFLNGLREMAEIQIQSGRGAFTGEFTTSRPNRLNLPASTNLGSHLVAIQKQHFPSIPIKRIKVGYSSSDSRRVSIEGTDESETRRELDFTRNSEPIVQRFVFSFERAAEHLKPFPIDLRFAQSVNNETLKYEAEGVIETAQDRCCDNDQCNRI